jgi:acylphosphatase
MTMIKRAILLVSGDVQDVGYRETVHELAFDMRLKGQVQNLENGNVEVIVEGEEGLLRNFAKKIRFREFPVEVKRIRKQFTNPTGKFKKFTVIPDDRLDKDMNAKIEHGFRYFKIMRKDISGSIKKMDSNMGKRLDRSDKKQGLTIKAIKGMDSHMGRRFDRLDSKYGEFGRTMKGMARDTRKSGKDVRATGGHIKTMARDMNGVKCAMTGMASDIKAIRNAATAPNKRKSPIPA